MQNTFDLSISVDADEWAYMKRRIAYLESVLVQIFRDKIHIQEWFDAATLCGLRLQGLPASRAGLIQGAKLDA